MVSKVYIAGVGFTPSGSSKSQKSGVTTQISAVTKALLDAGLGFDDISQGVTTGGKDESKAFKAFDSRGITVKEVKVGSEIASSFEQISKKNTACVLTIAADKSGTVALVLVSDKFLWKHPYLKDSAVSISKPSASKSQSGGSHKELCQKVWSLRGWSKDEPTSSGGPITVSGQTFELKRIGSSKVPKWEDIEHKHDGKDRLGYNPAFETREICKEDFEAVKAQYEGQSEGDQTSQFKQRGGDRAMLAKL